MFAAWFLFRLLVLKPVFFGESLFGISMLCTVRDGVFDIHIVHRTGLAGQNAVGIAPVLYPPWFDCHRLRLYGTGDADGDIVPLVPMPNSSLGQQAPVAVLDILNFSAVHQLPQLVFTNTAD